MHFERFAIIDAALFVGSPTSNETGDVLLGEKSTQISGLDNACHHDVK